VYLRNGYFQSPTGADTGTPILRINAVRPMSVDLSEARFLDEIDGSVDDYFIENGDLLFTRYNGSIDLLGVAGMVRGCTDKVLHPDKLIRIKLALGDPMPSFVEIAANVGASRKHMIGRARTTAGQTGISGTDVREMPIPLPPVEEQRKIVAEIAEKLSQIEAADIVIDHGLFRAARLRQSILKQAFEGMLVPQDPNDDPASELLEQVKSAAGLPKPMRKTSVGSSRR
jgi:type I restriction enzyme, S subunit